MQSRQAGATSVRAESARRRVRAKRHTCWLTHRWEDCAGSGTAFCNHPPHLERSVCTCWMEACMTLQARCVRAGLEHASPQSHWVESCVTPQTRLQVPASAGRILSPHNTRWRARRSGRRGGADTVDLPFGARVQGPALLRAQSPSVHHPGPGCDPGPLPRGVPVHGDASSIYEERGEGSGGGLGLGPYG